MKKVLFTLLGASLLTFAHAETILVPPTGEYKAINVEKENKLREKLESNLVSSEAKAKIVETITNDPGSYAPYILVTVANYYFSQKDLEKGVNWGLRGIYRSCIDVKMSQDETLGDVPQILLRSFGEFIKANNFTEKQYQEVFDKIHPTIEKWDLSTPRNYDRRWASLHSLGAFNNKPLNYLPESELEKVSKEFYKSMQ